MIQTTFPLALRILLAASAFLYATGNTAAINIDPFTFCVNTCKPGTCHADCKKICKDDSIWKQVAELQVSSDKGFRTQLNAEKDAGNKKKMREGMLYKTPIAQCLGIENPDKEAAKIGQPQPAKADSLLAPSAPTAPASLSRTAGAKNDLCAAAIRTEMAALEQNKTALQGQKDNLEAKLKELEAMK